MPEVAKQHGVSAQTIYSWRKHFGTLEPADVKRLRQLDRAGERALEEDGGRSRSGDRRAQGGSSRGPPLILRSSSLLFLGWATSFLRLKCSY